MKKIIGRGIALSAAIGLIAVGLVKAGDRVRTIQIDDTTSVLASRANSNVTAAVVNSATFSVTNGVETGPAITNITVTSKTAITNIVVTSVLIATNVTPVFSNYTIILGTGGAFTNVVIPVFDSNLWLTATMVASIASNVGTVVSAISSNVGQVVTNFAPAGTGTLTIYGFATAAQGNMVVSNSELFYKLLQPARY